MEDLANASPAASPNGKRSSKWEIVFLAVFFLGLLCSAILPLFGRATPQVRFGEAQREAKQLWEEVLRQLRVNGEAPSNVDEFVARSSSPEQIQKLLGQVSSNRISQVTFRDVRSETGGHVLFAADAPVKEPETKEIVRIVVPSTGPPFVMPESDFQSLLKKPSDPMP